MYVNHNDYELIYLIKEGNVAAKDFLFKKYTSLIKKMYRDGYYAKRFLMLDFMQEGFLILEKVVALNSSNNHVEYTYDSKRRVTKVNLKEARFEITKRDITITTASSGKEFDSTELYLDPTDENNYEASNLAVGHKVVFDSSKVEKNSITHIGSIENKYFYNVLDENGIDVSDNYNISYNYGTLTVYGSKLNIVVNDTLEKIYDQTTFNISDITWALQEKLPQGYTLVVKESNITDFVNVGLHDYKVLFDVLDDNNQVITDQFIFENIDNDGYYHSTLNIKQKEVVINLNDIEKTYDGNEVLFKDVTFAYDKEKVLKNLNFKVNANETVAFVGKSGSGKSTIFNLLCKMYDIDQGEITIDGININKLTKETIRGNITIINQNPYIFNMSIRDNLRLVKENLTDEEMIEACKMACLDDFIETLPDKYDTIVGEGGINLSGGQRQRLAIARAFVQKTEIILFDEATSALDNETQAKIQQAIENLQKDYTILIIAHRLSTVINSDRILFLNNGRIEAEGTHQELLKNCPEYKNLYESEIIKNK